MKRRVKVTAAMAFSLPILLGSPASALTAADDPIFDIAGQGMVEGEELIGHADGRVEKE